MLPASLRILPLSQLQSFVPGGLVLFAIALPLAGLVIGTILGRRFSGIAGILCAIYYIIVVVVAITDNGTRPRYNAFAVEIGLLIAGPFVGLIALAIGIPNRRKQIQPRGFPVVQNDTRNAVTPSSAPSSPPRP